MMVDNMKKITFILTLALLSACTVVSKSEEKNIEQNIGWLHGNCLAIKNTGIKDATRLTIVDLDSNKKFSPSIITGKNQSSDECNALLEDRKDINISNGYSFYQVKSDAPINLAIGFIKLDNANKLTFDYCTTSEGISFSVLKAKEKIWEGYYYLGYDSEPTCSEQD